MTLTMFIVIAGVTLNFLIGLIIKSDPIILPFIICSLTLTFFWYYLMCAYVTPNIEPHYTGEIIKFYANGTVLVDNGTVIPWPYGGR